MRWILFTGLIISAGAAAAPCDSDKHRQFDFWLGQWTVTTEARGVVGTNHIEKIVDGCALRETYTTPSGYHGTSYNSYNAATGQWQQTWVDNTGLTLLLAGQWQQGSMVLSGKGVSATGSPVLHRISWTPLADGRVRQLWETRVLPAESETWAPVFDGFYSPFQPAKNSSKR